MKQNLSLFSMLLFMVQVTVAQDAYMNLSHAGISPSATMTVEPDQEITFEYGGGGSHPMTDGHGSTPSPVFFQTVTVTSSNPIATFSLEEEGTYLFHCGTNPGNSGLWGTIIVESSTDTTVDVASGDVDMNGVMNYSDIIAMMTYFYGYATFTDEQIFEFEKRGIYLKWHNFNYPTYPQHKKLNFISGLACLDLFFWNGKENSRELFWENVGK